MSSAARPDADANTALFPTRHIDNVVPFTGCRGKPCALPPGFIAHAEPEPLSTFYASRRKARVVSLQHRMAWMKLGYGERIQLRSWPMGVGKSVAQLRAYAQALEVGPDEPRYILFAHSVIVRPV